MRSGLAATLLLLCSIAAAASAQYEHPDAQRASFTSPILLAAPAMRASAPPAPDRNAALAGLLSYYMPGVGSFYAGNAAHGFIHLGIHVVALGLFAASWSKCFMSDNSCPPATGAALVVMGVNDVWSVVTTVRDVHAFNRQNAARAPSAGPHARPTQ